MEATRGGELDHRVAVGVDGPAGWDEEEAPCGGAGGPVSDVGEVVGPGVDELQNEVAAGCVGYV